jgi:hypothetical protein
MIALALAGRRRVLEDKTNLDVKLCGLSWMIDYHCGSNLPSADDWERFKKANKDARKKCFVPLKCYSETGVNPLSSITAG